jgi:hypothetical protein
MAGESAHCFRDLKKPKIAEEFIHRAIETTDPTFTRTLSFIRMVHAASCLHRPDPDQAADIAIEAVALAGSLKSKRYLRYVRDLLDDFRPYVGTISIRKAAATLQGALG